MKTSQYIFSEQEEYNAQHQQDVPYPFGQSSPSLASQ